MDEIKVNVPDSEFSAEFVQRMAVRMNMSYHKYGPVADAYPHKVDAMKSMMQRVEKYMETGNAEHLVDAGNFLMIEFMRPGHRNAHFVAVDSNTSLGRSWYSGAVSQESNTLAQDNIRTGGQRGWTSGGYYRREGD
jgi:hypothetical protein